MATTTFTNYSTVIDASWLNDVDALVWDVFGGATTDAAAIAALGLDADLPTFSVPANTTISTYMAGILDDADEATLKASINLEIGTDVQAYDADLAAIAALAHTKGNVVMSDGSAWVSAPVYGRKNRIINGNFDIWQRNTTQTSAEYGSDDRWYNGSSGTTKTHSRQSFTLGQTDVPHEPRYYSRTVVSSVAGAANYCIKEQRIESVRTFAGQTATLSFYAKADAAKNIAVEFAQVFGTGGSPSSFVSISPTTVALTTSWAKYTITVAIPSISGKTIGTDETDYLVVVFWFDAGSNFNSRTNSLGQQSGTFEIAQVQFEKGSVATSFEQRLFAEELALCQRYYQKSYDLNTVPGTVTSNCKEYSYNANTYYTYAGTIRYIQRLRTSATPVIYSPATGTTGQVRDETAVTDRSATINHLGEGGFLIHGSGTWVTNNLTTYHWSVSAEL